MHDARSCEVRLAVPRRPSAPTRAADQALFHPIAKCALGNSQMLGQLGHGISLPRHVRSGVSIRRQVRIRNSDAEFVSRNRLDRQCCRYCVSGESKLGAAHRRFVPRLTKIRQSGLSESPGETNAGNVDQKTLSQRQNMRLGRSEVIPD